MATDIPAGVGVTVTYNVVPPTATISMPNQATISYLRQVPSISGTALGNIPLAGVQVAIKANRNPLRWMGAGVTMDQPAETWLTPTTLSSGNTSFAYAPAGLDSALQTYTTYYTIYARAWDVVGNTQTIFTTDISSRTFLYDNQAPTVQIGFPVDDGDGTHGRYTSSQVGGVLNSLAGTAADNPVGYAAGIANNGVTLALSYLQGPDTFYWTGATWSSGAAVTNGGFMVTATSTSSWTFSGNIGWLAGAHAYQLQARAIDNTTLSNGSGGGNLSAPSVVGQDIVNFIIQPSSPTVAITTPTQNATLNNLPTIFGTASDGLAGLAAINIQISSGSAPAYYWTGSSWTTTVTWNPVSVAGSWSYSAPTWATGNQFFLKAQVADNAGNSFTTAVTTFTYNTTPVPR